MVAIPGGVVASVGIQFAGRRFGSVGGMVEAQQPCHELHEGVGLEDPKNRG